MLAVASVTARHCLLAPEGLSALGASSRGVRQEVETEEIWYGLLQQVRVRELPPSCLGGGPPVASLTILPSKAELLKRYSPAYAAHLRVRRVWARVEDFWQAWLPEAFAALRPGVSEADIAAAERALGAEFPEDFAESLRCHDGQADFWFADAEPRQPAFRVLRLLPLDAATSAARSAPEEGAPLLPLAVQRSGGSHGGPNAGLEGAPKLKLRTGLDGRGSVRAAGCDRSAGDVWCADGQLDSRLSRSFTEYLSTYAEFLEALPAQLAAERKPCLADRDTLRLLFAWRRIDCDCSDSWVTTGLGKGKGNWSWAGRTGAVKVVLPRPAVKGQKDPAAAAAPTQVHGNGKGPLQ